jgi:alkyl sulfatase BDS1-like metallo-beta-lactamase superfamily hydrolase
MLDDGLVAAEIAETIQLPPALEEAWNTRGYYSSLSHNAKAVHHRYLAWFEGNPATLWEHPPTEQATRHVDRAGGGHRAWAKARAYAEKGDLRFAATVLNYLVFADAEDAEAKDVLAWCTRGSARARRTAPGATSI